MKTLTQRMTAKTPLWFRRIRNIGLILTGIGTAIITAPVTLPAIVITIGGYLVTAGSVAAIVSQTATVDD
jgi:ABC-type xylose transport system permease subunit